MHAIEAGQSTLQQAAFAVLMQNDPHLKAHASQALSTQIDLNLIPDVDRQPPQAIDTPGRPAKPELVSPKLLKPRKLGSEIGRATLLHAIAHIEFNAINLAWDAVYRFAAMPSQFYHDWASVAADEARHFQMLRARLLDLGFDYGDFPAHNGLWDMACKTRSDVTTRMALVPRVLEARGLDVTPGMIGKLKAQGDLQSVEILETILEEEVRHVQIGSDWFFWLCERQGIDAAAHFTTLIQRNAPGLLVLPFNTPHRLRAGFSQDELDALSQLAANAPLPREAA